MANEEEIGYLLKLKKKKKCLCLNYSVKTCGLFLLLLDKKKPQPPAKNCLSSSKLLHRTLIREKLQSPYSYWSK